MFWKRKPKCPITNEDKEWIEGKLNWIDANVVKLKNQPTILPTKKYFDWQFTGDQKDADFVLKRVAAYFGIETEEITLNFYSEEAIELANGMITQKEEGKGTAGLYVQDKDDISIWIEVQQLKKPISLIATIAHELSHYVLMAQKNVYLEGDENEWLTDLLSVAYGFGIFIGNTKFEFSQFQSGDGWGGWQFSTQGYLPLQITAYAMAEIEKRKKNETTKWVNLLKKDFRNDYLKSMKYLNANR